MEPTAYYGAVLAHVLHCGPHDVGYLTPEDMLTAKAIFDSKYGSDG